MKAWQKGAIVGAVWGLLASFSYLVGEATKPPLAASTLMGKVLLVAIGIFWIPIWFAVLLGFRFQLVFIGAPITGAIIGAIIGYFLEKIK